MKVLFLDIDGVICLHEEGDDHWGETEADDVFDRECCRRLKEIVDKTKCKLVLSSWWRLDKDDIRRMLDQLLPYGITKKDFIGITPLGRDRGDEIMAFVEKHPEIESFAAIDDEPFRSCKFPADKLVLTARNSGITEDIKDWCLQIFDTAAES